MCSEASGVDLAKQNHFRREQTNINTAAIGSDSVPANMFDSIKGLVLLSMILLKSRVE